MSKSGLNETKSSLINRILKDNQEITLGKGDHYAILSKEDKRVVKSGMDHNGKYFTEPKTFDQNLVNPDTAKANLQTMKRELEGRQRIKNKVVQFNLQPPKEEPMFYPVVIRLRMGVKTPRMKQAELRKAAEESLRKLQGIPIPALLDMPRPLVRPAESLPFVPRPVQPFNFVPPPPSAPNPALVRAIAHRDRLVQQRNQCGSGNSGRARRAVLNLQIREVERRISELVRD